YGRYECRLAGFYLFVSVLRTCLQADHLCFAVRRQQGERKRAIKQGQVQQQRENHRGSTQMFSSMQPTELKDVIENYLPAFERLLKAIDSNAIERIARRLCVAPGNEATIYVAGNGGAPP